MRALRTAAPTLADALEIGTPALKRSEQLSARLVPTFQSIERLADDPLVALGVRDLTNTAQILNPTLATLTPVQTVCNYITLWFRNVASLLSEGGSNGTTQRFIILAAPQGPNNEGGPSSAPANGPEPRTTSCTRTRTRTPPRPARRKECEAGNETYAVGRQVIGNVPGNQGTLHDSTTRSTTK